MNAVEAARRAAALKAIELIKDNYVVGLGSGNTMASVAAEIPSALIQKKIVASFIPTSHQIESVATRQGLRLVSLNEYPEPDLALDGADQVDQTLDLIKGGGAALLREKIVASAAKRFVVIVDEQKVSQRLHQPVPVEAIPFAHQMVIKRITALGGKPALREGNGKVGPIVTDNGNFIVDSNFGEIENPRELEVALSSIPGIIGTGLFVEMVSSVYVGKLNGTVEILKRS